MPILADMGDSDQDPPPKLLGNPKVPLLLEQAPQQKPLAPPPPPIPEKPILRRKFAWGRLFYLVKIFCRCCAEFNLKPLWEHLEKQGGVLKRTTFLAPDLVAIIAVILLVCGVLWERHALSPIIDSLKSANSYKDGIIATQSNNMVQLKSDNDSIRRSNEATTIQSKLDLNEMTRQRDQAQQQAALFAAGPSNIFNLINLITNSLDELESVVPRFNLYANSQVVTNRVSIKALTNRTMALRVLNEAQINSDNLVVKLYIPKGISPTNVNASGWTQVPDEPRIVNNMFVTNENNIWAWALPGGQIQADSYCGLPDVSFSTNIQFGVTFVTVEITATRAKRQQFDFFISFY